MANDPTIEASLLEAQQYERRQVLRRRGLVCLQYGLFALGLAMWGLEIIWGRESALEFFLIAAVFLAGLPINIAMRRKPAWNLVFREYAGKPPAPWRYALMATIGLAFLVLPMERLISDSVSLAGLVILPMAIPFSAGWRAKDWTLFHLGWLPLAAAVVTSLTLPDAWLVVVGSAALAVPLLILAFLRIFGPRTWHA